MIVENFRLSSNIKQNTKSKRLIWLPFSLLTLVNDILQKQTCHLNLQTKILDRHLYSSLVQTTNWNQVQQLRNQTKVCQVANFHKIQKSHG